MSPPRTRKDVVIDRLHGLEIADPFRWLEGASTDPASASLRTDEIAEWTEAQNRFTRQVLDGLPQRAQCEERLANLIEIDAVTAPVVRRGRWFYSKRVGAKAQPTLYVREHSRGEDQLLFDPLEQDPSGLTAVEWFSPSPDGRLVAIGCYQSGDERTQLRIRDVDHQRWLNDAIDGKVESPDWLPDSSGFIYRHLRDIENPYSARVCLHRLGDDPVADLTLVEQKSPNEDPVLATTWGPHAKLSDDGRWVWLGYWTDTQSIDGWVLRREDLSASAPTPLRVVTKGEKGVAHAHFLGDRLILHTTKGAPNGRVIAAELTAETLQWIELIPERADAAIEAVSLGRDAVVVTYLHRACSQIRIFNEEGRLRGDVTLPGLGSATVTAECDRTTAYVTFTSFNFPTTIFEADLATPTAPLVIWERPAAPVREDSVSVEQVWYPSRDGTPISMFVIHRTDLERDGNVPCLVTGYGGFNISETPTFVPTWFQWFEVGGLVAVPNLRGGGEYGDAWHEAGMRDRKQNVFDDFHAAIEYLIDAGWTRPERVAVAGGSNGGLLTGVTVTQRPDLCRAAIVAVPLLDMLRYQHFLMARYWVPEYGSSDDPAQLAYLRAYSPYHNVVSGLQYPAVFLTAGEHDTRVHPMHARKMAAALQAATDGVAGSRPVLLWIDRDAGHGQGKPLHLRLQEIVDQRLFLMWQLGMLETAAG